MDTRPNPKKSWSKLSPSSWSGLSLYFILLCSGWMLALSGGTRAPNWLVDGPLIFLTGICVLHAVSCWARPIIIRSDGTLPGDKAVDHLVAIIGAGFLMWGCGVLALDQANQGSALLFLLIALMAGAVYLAPVVSIWTLGTLNGVGAIILVTVAAVKGSFALALAFVAVVSSGIVLIIARREVERFIRSKRCLEYMLDDMPVAVMTVDPTTYVITYVNDTSLKLLKKIENLLPIKPDDIVGRSIDIFHKNPHYPRKILSNPKNLPHHARIALGDETLDLQITAIRADDSGDTSLMLAWSIVTEEVKAEKYIYNLAHYDRLTGLANRNMFLEQVNTSLATAQGNISLLLIDIDDFKTVNETKGHRVGDVILEQVANRLRRYCTKNMTVARVGGDEFAVLVPSDEVESPENLAHNWVEALGGVYFSDNGSAVRLDVSIGFATAPARGKDIEALFAHADMALYSAKLAGRSTVRSFQPEMETRVHNRVKLEEKLRLALDNEGNLFVFYQPIIDIKTGKITAREALIRWCHPQRGWISPAEFVPVAETNNLINRLGIFVLNSACHEATTWKDNARVAVNVSASQLGYGMFPALVRAALASSGLTPDRLEIEVTETALLGNEAEVMKELRAIHDMGVQVALDDFGTGYSSLAHLRSFPFNKIKIDGSFVRDALTRPDCAAIVGAIADLGKRLGVTTVAECVETQAHLDCVVREGCHEAQGYFYSRPVPRQEDEARVKELNRLFPSR